MAHARPHEGIVPVQFSFYRAESVQVVVLYIRVTYTPHMAHARPHEGIVPVQFSFYRAESVQVVVFIALCDCYIIGHNVYMPKN